MLDDLLARFAEIPKGDQDSIKADVIALTDHLKWIPNPGPQTDAYFSKADILFYGGQGGGGKSDLGLGLAFTAHQRSLILRREYANLGALTDRAKGINGGNSGYNGSPPPSLRTDDGRLIQFAGNQYLGDEQKWQGHPFDLKVFDEASQFLELQVRFHAGWLRSTDQGQRKRMVLGSNPPLDASGDWLIGMFRPWLDPLHPKPARHGELRWFVTAPDGTDLEVDGPNPIKLPGDNREFLPTSRTFIPAALKDNPHLINTGYQAQLDSLLEPIRSAVRDGNFMIARSDDPRQVIPSDWVRAAQARWHDGKPKDATLTAMGVDVAQGGADKTVLASLYGNWFDTLKVFKGIDTKDGPAVAALVIQHMRDRALVVIDMGGGWGGSARDHLKAHNYDVIGVNPGSGSEAKSVHGGQKFLNARAEMWWRFREALDPNSFANVALPPGQTLAAQLSAPTWDMPSDTIKIESKDDIRERLGSSTDEADAVIMAWFKRHNALMIKGRAQTTQPRNYTAQSKTPGQQYINRLRGKRT